MIINTSANLTSFIKHNNAFLYSMEESIIQIVSLAFIIIAGLSGNFYVCYIIYGSRNKNPTLLFILNLAFANIGALTLCTPLPMAISIQRRFDMDNWICLTSGFLNNFFFCASIFILLLLTIHKFFTVVKPGFGTHFNVSEKRPKACLLTVWICCSVMSMLSLGPFTGWEHISFNPTTAHCGISFPVSVAEKLRLTALAALAFVFPLAFMAYAYCKIYLKINAHEKRLAGKIRRKYSMKRKLSLTLCMMFGTFVACWSPFFLLIVLAIMLKDPADLPQALGRIAYWFGYINCCLNPVFYCIRASTFRELMRERSGTISHNVNFAVPNRGKRAFSLPSLPNKRRNSSSVGSAAVSPSPILVENVDSTSNKSIQPSLRIPRMRAFSWTADFRLPGILTTQSAQSSHEIILSRPRNKQNSVRKVKLIKTSPETISESPVESYQMQEEIVLNVTPRGGK